MNKKITLHIEAPEELITGIAHQVIDILGLEKSTSIQALTEENYTVKEAAKIAKCAPITIRRHINEGLLIANKVGKSFLINKTNLDNYVQGN